MAKAEKKEEELELLYHYCSKDTFKKILQKPRLKLSDVTQSNDRMEINLLWDFCQDLYRKNNNLELSNMIDYEHKNKMNNNTYLSLSLSEDSDVDILWSLYASGGYCLGFSKKYLKGLASHLFINKGDYDSITKSYKTNVIFLDEYGKSERASVQKVHYFNEYELINDIYKNSNPNIVFEKLSKQAPYSKTNFWTIEKEWRFLFDFENDPIGLYPYLDEHYNNFTTLNSEYEIYPEKAFDESNNEVTFKYQKIKATFIPFEKDELKEVAIAPNNDIKVNEVKETLKEYGFSDSIKVTKSKIQL